MDFDYLQKILTAGIFYMPFLGFVGFGIFVFIIGITTFITGTVLFFCLAVYGLYATLRDTGLIQASIEKFKSILKKMDIDILKNIDDSFVLQDTINIPKSQALFLCHPHGVMGMSWFYHFCHPFRSWSATEKRPYLALHSMLFKFPFLRELITSFGCIESSEHMIRTYLEKGESVAIITGGAEEMMYSDEDLLNLVLKKRKGYARIAKDYGIPIVPLLSVNENGVFPQHTSFLWKSISHFLFWFARISFPFPSWKAVRNWIQILQKPLPQPIETFVLKPIETKNKNLDTIRKETVERIENFLLEKKINHEFIE